MKYRDQFGYTWMTAYSADLRRMQPSALTDMAHGLSTQRHHHSSARRLRMAAPRLRPAPPAPRPKPSSRSPRRRHVFAEGLFRSVLQREQRCAERFEQRLLLLLVGSDVTAVAAPQDALPPWAPIIDALTTAAGDTALVGWLRDQSVLGAVVPHVGGDAEALLLRELAQRLGREALARLSVRTHIYSPDVTAHPNEAPLTGFVRQQTPPDRRARVRDGLKRALDIVGSLALLFLLLPVFVAIAAVMKLTSPGPILFRQPRIGRMGKPFTMLKFRTMSVNADPAVHRQFVTQFINGADLGTAGPSAMFKLTNDSRITPLGRLLRNTSLDELPQFFNVLRGDMSLVGPRPPLAYEVEQYRPWHWRRLLEAKPGITGLWQVNGRSRTTFDEMVRLDLRYARKNSLWMDIKILLATPRAVISGKGAA